MNWEQMNWEQKFAAIQALVVFGGDVNLRMRSPGDWYVSAPLERVEGHILSGSGIAEPTPEKAVVAYWEWLTGTQYHIRTSLGKEFLWNGFMWQEQEPKK